MDVGACVCVGVNTNQAASFYRPNMGDICEMVISIQR